MSMTEHDGVTIHKHPLHQDGGVTEIDLPSASKVLTVQTDPKTGWAAVWVELNPKHPPTKKLVLQVVVTGGAVPLGDYYGTFQTTDTDGSNFVGHVYGHWA